MNSFAWASPTTLAQALELRSVTVAAGMLSGDGRPPLAAAVLKAGGIDVLGLMKDGLLTPARIVNLRTVAELGGIAQRPDGTLAIGANVTLAELSESGRVRASYRALADAAGRSASPQLREVATIGGNLLQRPRCWYFRSLHHHCLRKGGSTCFAFAGENQHHALFAHRGCAIVHPSTPATALVAFGAKLELVRAGGATRVVPLESFLILPERDPHRENDLRDGEILTTVVLPQPDAGVRSAHLRLGETESFDWPLADVAVVLDLDADRTCRRASVVLGAAAPVPYRARGAESALVGERISEDSARRAARAAIAGAAPLDENAHKVPIFETLVRRTILQAARPT